MFTGIIEAMGTVTGVKKNNSNLTFSIQSPFLHEVKIDQSIAHNGVCLTVDGIFDDHYTVTAIDETLQKTNLGDLQPGSLVNLERCLRLGDRLDGHIVQGHVDTTARVIRVTDHQGSWEYGFEYEPSGFITVSKGSICVNGVSLTVVQSAPGNFSVAIIPYTFEHTNFKNLQPGSRVNLEFDLVGKYILEASRLAPYLHTDK
jgi:riboflavin synthase